MLIKLAGLVPESYVDGPGIRFTIFVQGCPHHCEGCHNPETHDFDAGRMADTDKIYNKIKQFPLVKGTLDPGHLTAQTGLVTRARKRTGQQEQRNHEDND